MRCGENMQDIDKVEKRIQEMDLLYHENKGNKYLISLLGIIIGILSGYILMPILYSFFHS
jgi:acid phosphatase family membrane protein YuiD